MVVPAVSTGVSAFRWGRIRRRIADNFMAYLFMAAAIACFAFFSWYPLYYGFQLAFQQNNFIDPAKWVGFANYRHVIADPNFKRAWTNTIRFSVFALLLGAAVPFFTALLLNELRHFKGYLRVAVYTPVMLPPVVVCLLWRYFYTPSGGPFNFLLHAAHLPTSQWVQSADANMVMLSLVFCATWGNMGAATIIYLAALRGIPGEIYEASEIDGAGFWRRLRDVTLPHMRFIVLVMVLLQIIATMQVFTEPFVLGGGPTNEMSMTLMTMIYQVAFVTPRNFGYAAALSTMLFTVLLAFSALYLFVTRTRD